MMFNCHHSARVNETTDLDQSHDADSEDSDAAAENLAESDYYDGDVDTESYLSASSSSASDTSSVYSVTDPACYAGRDLTDQDNFLLLTSCCIHN